MLGGSAATAAPGAPGAPALTPLNWLLSASAGAKTRVQFFESGYVRFSLIFKGVLETKAAQRSVWSKTTQKKLVWESNFSI